MKPTFPTGGLKFIWASVTKSKQCSQPSKCHMLSGPQEGLTSIANQKNKLCYEMELSAMPFNLVMALSCHDKD